MADVIEKVSDYRIRKVTTTVTSAEYDLDELIAKRDALVSAKQTTIASHQTSLAWFNTQIDEIKAQIAEARALNVKAKSEEPVVEEPTIEGELP